MLTIYIMPNGNLNVALKSESAKEELKEMLAHDPWLALSGAFKDEILKGHYTPFDASKMAPFVAQSSGACVAESMDYTDDGQPCIVGRLWCYRGAHNPVFDLIENGRTEFMKA